VILQVDAPDDPRIAPYARVGDHGWLSAGGLFVAEGRLILERLLDSGAYELQSVLVTPAACSALRPRLEALGSHVYVAPQPVLDAVTGFNFHRGCLALAHRPAPLAIDRLVTADRLLLAEGVGNPDNVGGLFRAAAALRCGGILLDRRSADPFYRKALRTSMGAALRVPFARVEEWRDPLRTLRARGFRVVALTPDPSARALNDAVSAVPRNTRVALMVGAEGAGLSHEALTLADEQLRIPIAPDVDSLNVVVAAAIAMYVFADLGSA
jgi:tRNA G18 (ribose-2'-O)-methylase SpoU